MVSWRRQVCKEIMTGAWGGTPTGLCGYIEDMLGLPGTAAGTWRKRETSNLEIYRTSRSLQHLQSANG